MRRPDPENQERVHSSLSHPPSLKVLDGAGPLPNDPDVSTLLPQALSPPYLVRLPQPPAAHETSPFNTRLRIFGIVYLRHAATSLILLIAYHPLAIRYIALQHVCIGNPTYCAVLRFLTSVTDRSMCFILCSYIAAVWRFFPSPVINDFEIFLLTD